MEMDSSEVGRYGTLHLMKRLDMNAIAASYPIDEEEITIGRDASCSIRLYYNTVSPIHCTLIFRERKAFIVVLGVDGLSIDGCPVYPANSQAMGPVTVPLPNNSTIEIHKKRFRFSYPPKELRPVLLSTPPRYQDVGGRNRRRTLRMSMIKSAQVFSPGPSEDPRENLRILQSPIKTPLRRFAPRASSPLKRGAIVETEEDENEEEEVVLVETNHPKVIEEDKDLIIMEHVEVEVPQLVLSTPGRAQNMVQYPIPANAQPPPQLAKTPRRRPHPRASLHRAVLIRSAQRTALRIEMEAEEAQDVEEVEDTIQPMEMEDVEEVNEEGEADDEDGEEATSRPIVSGWRKSLEAMKSNLGWPFRASSVNKDEEEDEEEAIEEERDIVEEAGEAAEEAEEPAEPEEEQDMSLDFPETEIPAQTVGPPATPQPLRLLRDRAKYSIGGSTPGDSAMSGPRRVKLVNPWKVNDIVVPLKDVKEEDKPASNLFASPKKERLTEEEIRTIQERRRSALRTPDTFAPGIDYLSKSGLASPAKGAPPLPAPNFGESSRDTSNNDEGEDPVILLARMKQMVNGVKHRQSLGLRPSLGPGASPKKAGEFSLFAPGVDPSSPRKTSGSYEAGSQGGESQGSKDAADTTEEQEEDIVMADDRRHAPQASSSRHTLDALVSATPRFTGVRELFKEAAQEIQTPKMDGVRELFRFERAMPTPSYEGVGEMLSQPSEPQATAKNAGVASKTRDGAASGEPARRPPSRTKKPPSTSIPAPKPILPRPIASGRRTPNEQMSSVSKDNSGPSESSQPARPTAAARVVRKPRSNAEEVTLASGKAEGTLGEAGPAKPPSRRGRKAADPAMEGKPSAPASKSTARKPRTLSTPTEEFEDPPTTGYKTSGSRRTVRGKQADVTEASSSAVPPEGDKKDEGARVRRSTRSRVKEEDTDESPVLTTVPEEAEANATTSSKATATIAANTRTRKTPTARVPTPTTRGAAARSKPGSSLTKKTSTEDSAKAGSGHAGDKENTPESVEEPPVAAVVSGKPASGTRGSAKVTRSSSKLPPLPVVELEERGKETRARVSRSKTATKK